MKPARRRPRRLNHKNAPLIRNLRAPGLCAEWRGHKIPPLRDLREGGLDRQRLGSRPVSAQRVCGPLRLDPMRRVEVVALLEHVEGEVREDVGRSLGHPAVVSGLLWPPSAK